MKRKLTMFLALFFVGIGLAVAQTQVRGVVVDENDIPVIGATIQVRGTSQGTITDIDGKFSLSAPSNGTLVISYVGYVTQEVPVSASVNITLVPDTEVLDEVLVVAYGTTTKGAFTGSAGVIDSDKLQVRQVSDVSNALSGNVAGVQVLSDNGQPGTSAKVRIRGVGSINAGMEPLYVVDGVPYDGDLSAINTADIASMTVLKDAASTALYGSRGANGIIMITTKQGKGKSQVSFDARYGVNSRSVKNYDVLTSPKNYLEREYEAIYNAGIYSLGYDPVRANRYANSKITTESEGGSGYTIYTVPEGELLIGTNGMLNPNATLGYSDGEYYYIPDDWTKETFSNKSRQEYNLSISGSSDKGSHYISVGYLNDKGVVENSGFERISTRMNGDYNVKDWLKVGANMSYNRSNSQFSDENTATASSGNAFYIANFIAPIYPMYVRNASDQQIALLNGKTKYDYGDGKSTNFSRKFMSIANPMGDLLFGDTNYAMDVFNGSWYADVNPIEGLTLTARYGLNLNNRKYSNLGSAYMGQSSAYGGSAYQALDRYYGFNQQYLAYYTYTPDNVNHFDITAGYEEYSYSHQNLYATGQNLYNPDSYYVSNAIDNLKGGGYEDTYSTRGFLTRLNYSYDNKYFANLAFRRDASSRFHPDKRWGNFWSASAAWMLSDEDFLEDVSWINMLKLKASFGQQGNDAIGNYYAWLDQYRMTGADGVFADGALVYKGNPDLSWETSTSYNIGFDYALLNNTLTGSLEYFGRKSGDMLYNKPTAGSLGYTSIPMNIGSMTNSGIELDINWNAVNTRDVNMDVYLNATSIKNRINELHPDLEGKMIDGSRIYEEGKSMYRMYLVEYAGVNAETGLAEYWTTDPDTKERVRTSDYSVALSSKTATKDLMPKLYGGFGTSISAYGFDASVQFAYQLGGKLYDNGYARLMHGCDSSSGGLNWHKDIYNAWTPQNTDSDIPRLNANDKYTNSLSTRFLTSSDYLSLNNITFGYTVPIQKLTSLDISKLRVYVSADNVGILTARKGLDPRQSYISATTALYTPIRSVSGGISLTF
jgi:TonB-linked SusC/RagA family outer membrane protein